MVVADLNSPETLIKEFKDKVVYVRCDVGVEEDVKKVVKETIARFGKVDILINNAVMTGVGALPDVDTARWNRIIGTNTGRSFIFARPSFPT